MIAQGHIERGPPPAQTMGYDDAVLDHQRSGGGLLVFLLFPLISIAAIVFAAIELIS